MKVGYLDTSWVLAIAFDEPGADELARVLEGYDELVSSNLLEAEYRAALRREDVGDGIEMLAGVAWILPNRPLAPEFERILDLRYLRGADLWHLAVALFLAEEPSDVDFLTLDVAQREAAARAGFTTPSPTSS